MDLLIIIILVAAGLNLVLYISMLFSYRKYILKIQQLDKYKYALVLGAGLEKDSSPSDILMDRITTAIDLYHAKKADYLVMSGSKGEPDAMVSAALSYDIPESVLLIDKKGNSTFNSCLNIRETYSPSSVLIVSQSFHLPRALMLQRLLGVEAFGVSAHNYHFSLFKKAYWTLREVFALPYNLLKYSFFLIKN